MKKLLMCVAMLPLAACVTSKPAEDVPPKPPIRKVEYSAPSNADEGEATEGFGGEEEGFGGFGGETPTVSVEAAEGASEGATEAEEAGEEGAEEATEEGAEETAEDEAAAEDAAPAESAIEDEGSSE